MEKIKKEEPQTIALFKGISSAYLFTLQSGSHPNVKSLAVKILTLTLSFLTLLMFIWYSCDITAEMTSGSPDIPIRNFDDVLDQGYKVFAKYESAAEKILAESQPGSAKHEVNEKYSEKVPWGTNGHLKVLSEEKTLWLTGPTPEAESREMKNKFVTLKMDDLGYGVLAFLLQYDSEFRDIFNYFILKEIEVGVFKKVENIYFGEEKRHQQFGIHEPQPLGFNNVMFPFSCLGLSISVALAIAAMEAVINKCSKKAHK